MRFLDRKIDVGTAGLTLSGELVELRRASRQPRPTPAAGPKRKRHGGADRKIVGLEVEVVATVAIEEIRVVVVGHLLRDDELDLVTLRRFGEAVRKRVVRVRVRAEQELSLCAATREHVELSR